MLNFLVCDDNINMLNNLSNMLESIFIKNDLKATVAFKATSDNELLSYTKENHIDVFILDINLNCKLNGLELAKNIRKNNKDCYIIFIYVNL